MAEKTRRFSPLTALGDGILLLCALCGLAGSFLSIYTNQEARDWADVSVLARCAAQGRLFLTCAVLFALLSLAVWSLPRFWGAAAGSLTVLWLLWVWWSWDDVLSGAMFTCKTIADLFAARVDWGNTFPFTPGLSLSPAAAHTRLFLLAALALLALILGWAVVRARRWWLVLALTLPPLLPGLLADLYPDWPPFLALAACWCAMILCDLCRWAAPSARGKLTLISLPCAVSVLLFITLAFPREGYTRPQWALDAEIALHNTANRTSEFFSQWEGPFGSSGVTYVGSAGEADLTHAGPLRYSGRTVLRVAADYTGLMYLRGSSLAVYEDGVWKPLPEGTWQEYSDRLADGESTLSPLIFPTGLNGRTATSTVSVENIGAAGSCVYSPYFLADQDWTALGMLPVEDSYFAYQKGQQAHTMEFCPPEVVPFYGHSTDEEAVYRDYVYAHYLDVPDKLRDRLDAVVGRALAYPAALTPEGKRCYQIEYAQRIAAWMVANFEYDPDTPAARSGVDPVLYFLTESRRGYCMHYASAAALMLRETGVPARYVSGFFADCVGGKTVDIPDRAAHAWVEVWLDGFGWYPVDVTPAAYQWYQEQQNAESAVPADEPSLPPEESETPEPTPTPSPTPGPGPSDLPSQAPGEADAPAGDSFTLTLPEWAKWVVLALGGSALLWLGQFLLKRHRAARMSGPDPNRAALACYGYLATMERWGGHISPRAVELAEKAKFSRHTLTQTEVNELRLLVDGERTRLCVVKGPVVRLVNRCWWGMPSPPAVLRRVPPPGRQDGDKKPPNP